MARLTRVVVVLVAVLLALAPTPAAARSGDVSGIDIRLSRATGATVSGRITSAPDGAAVAQAWVSLLAPSRDWSEVYARTHAAGRFRIPRVAPGTYHLLIETSAKLPDGYYRAGAPGRFTIDRAEASCPDRVSPVEWMSSSIVRRVAIGSRSWVPAKMPSRGVPGSTARAGPARRGTSTGPRS